jgi:regulator of protease activity HflC (stomatin/prohibitin superfamily)
MAIAIILGIVLFILAVVAGVLAYFAFDNENKAGGIASVVACVALALAFICVPFSIRTVDAGEIAVVKEMGKIIDTREDGTHFDFWMVRKYDKYDTKVRQIDITTASYSKDSQPIDLQMVVQYQVDKAEVKTIALTYGSLTALENRIQSVTIEKTKSIISQYSAENLISQRPELSAKVTEEVGAALANGYYIHVTNIALTNIDFSDAFEASVEAKMIAEQTKLQKDYENEAAEAAAETAKKVAEMQADAEAYAKEKAAEAEANAIIARANAEAEALNIQTLEVAKMLGLTELVDGIEVIKSNLTLEEAELIKAYIEYIKYLESWNGELPDTVVGDNVGVILPTNP